MACASFEIDHLVKNYQLGDVPVHVLKGISLEIERGEFVAIMGPSGSGKSTLMNILGCLDKPTAGTYMLDGIECRRDSTATSSPKSATGRSASSSSSSTCWRAPARLENVELPLLYTDDARARERRDARHGGAAARSAWPSATSTTRASFPADSSSASRSPARWSTIRSIILADEPTGALDSRTSIEIMAIFQRLNREPGITMIVVTHEPDIAAYAKRNIHFKDGRLQQR